MNRHNVFLLSFLCMAVFLLGCTSPVPSREGQPIPALTFEHMAPLFLNVGHVSVENAYDPQIDPADISSRFPVPPDIALRRYAEARLQAQGVGGDTLKFIIEDARVHQDVIAPDNVLLNWMGSGGEDRYTVLLKLRMYTVSPEGGEGAHSILTFQRSLQIPESASLGEREHKQFRFMESVMGDVDRGVSEVLQRKMGL